MHSRLPWSYQYARHILLAEYALIRQFSVCGAAVTILGFYKPQNLVGWALSTIGIGLLTLIKADSSKAEWVGFQVIEGLGLGILCEL